jgi:asparagine synthase (glutamine-hydrolysing)
MCGIAGYIGKSPPKTDNLKKTSEILHHRGPDGEGFFTHQLQNQSVALVHRRLAIIDLEPRSNQPFHYQDTVLIYNGEIYNYLEVRHKLEELGHKFKTRSDTEVLIHALCHWGKNAMDNLEGMWAFAWYNKINGSLLLSRDRFGEKPLYIWKKNNGIYFASEVKGLATLAGEYPKVNEAHLIRSLINGYKSIYKTKETYFKEVKELHSGTFLNIDYKSIDTPISYWMPKLTEDKNLSFDDAVETTKDAMINAVKLRMRSDVPLAFCMSGGVDSNSLISIASKELGYNVHGFTIMNTDSRYEEQELVEQSVKELDIKHTSVSLSKKNFLSNMRHLVVKHDSPVSTISYYVHWLLMDKISKSGYKISISGTGADELFSGYYDHHLLYLASISKNEELYKISKNNWFNHVSPIVRNKYLQDPDRFVNNINFRDHIYTGKDFVNYLHEPFFESFKEKEYQVSLLRKRMLNELFEEVVPVILHEDDANSMYHSIENRSPFLDRRLFETSLKIPTKYLIQNGKAKSVLRESMRGIAPNVILDCQKKVGFNAPIEDLLDMNNPNNREQILGDSCVYNIIKRELIEKMLSKKIISNEETKFLFTFLGIKFFLEEFSF